MRTLRHSFGFAWQQRVAETSPDPGLFLLRGWRTLSIIYIGKFVYMSYHFILPRLNPFDLRVDREGWWFEHSLSYLRVFLSAESAEIVCWLRLYLLQRLGSLTMALTCKFVYMVQHFILLRLNPFDLRVDQEGISLEHFVS